MVKKVERNRTSFKLTIDERESIKKFIPALSQITIRSILLHPISFAKVLFQLGHEPYPPTFSKPFIYFGRDALYLPNVLVYLRNTIRVSGISPIFQGIEASVLSNVVSNITHFVTQMYLDRFYPTIGGDPMEEKDESQMSNHEHLRVMVRLGIRRSIAHTVGSIASRPFTVIMIRQIAQYAGGEEFYSSVLSSLWRIGHEEGLAGLFAGFVPHLIEGYITIWGISVIKYAAERLLENTFDKENEDDERACKNVRFALNYGIPVIVGTLSYPFCVVSTVMAVSGSGLIASLLPYSPPFGHWMDAYNYMKPNMLTRGSNIFCRKLREVENA